MIGTATYSPDDNKLRLAPFARLDRATYDRLKEAGFKWAPRQEVFVAPMWTPGREDLLIELCGEIGDDDVTLTDRAEERAERFDDYSDKRAKDAQSARAGVSEISGRFEFGQPILVGHHSERKARKDAERMENGMRKAVKMWETAQYWERRAAGALAHAKYKELPAVRARRIKGIEADKRKTERNRVEAEKWLKLWSKDGLTHDEAVRIANVCWLHMPRKEGDREDFTQAPSAHTVLTNAYPNLYAPRTVAEVVEHAKKAYPRTIAHCNRWITHYENRLAYERAMLQEQGASELLDKKPRRELLPLCNYRAPEGVKVENMYHRGEFSTYPQREMTKAEYAAINGDYKGVRVVGRSHRVRTAMINHALYCVFLTDSKVHDIPEDKAAPTLPPMTLADVPAPRPVKPADPVAEEFKAIKTQLKAGVQIVSAPQLFPTPEDLAARMVDLAGIEPGMRVLEPSAGTGRILEQLPEGCDVVAVEINAALGGRLYADRRTVVIGDFLQCTPETLWGSFDRILMNPPFANAQDIDHIKHAFGMLKPGGTLVAICANGPRQAAQLRPLAEQHGGTWEALPAGTFAESGTNVNTAILTMHAAQAVTAKPQRALFA